MQIKNEIVISKSAKEVWKVLGEQFGSIHIWASAINHSAASGQAISGEVCDTRSCDIQGMGKISEKVLEFDGKNFVLVYEVVKGFPFFVKRGVNRWTLTPEGANTRLSMNAKIETKGIVGFAMEPMMKMQMSSMLKKTAEELKYFVEFGKPHPRKKAS